MAVFDTRECQCYGRIRDWVFELFELAGGDPGGEGVGVVVDVVLVGDVFGEGDRAVCAFVECGAEPGGERLDVLDLLLEGREKRGGGWYCESGRHANDLDVLVSEAEDLCCEELEDRTAVGFIKHVEFVKDDDAETVDGAVFNCSVDEHVCL